MKNATAHFFIKISLPLFISLERGRKLPWCVCVCV